MYVTNNDDSTVSVIDTNTNTVIGTIPVGANPQGIAYDLNQTIYVANIGGITVSVIDTNTNTIIDTIPVGNQPSDLAFDPLHERIYVTNFDDGTVSVINLCPRPELQQQSTNDIISTTVNNKNDHTMIKNII